MMLPALFRIIGIVFLISILCLISPVMAGDKYSSGQPDISAAIVGSNELHTGEQMELTVALSNSGVFTMKFVDDGAITPDYLPTTALSLSAGLGSGGSPVKITADPQILGDIKSGDVVQATFPVTVPDSASTGSYLLPLTVSYQYMDQATQTGIDDIEYSFKTVEKTLTPGNHQACGNP